MLATSQSPFGRGKSEIDEVIRAADLNELERAPTLRTIGSCPMTFADTCAGFQIICATFRASGQTLINLLVNGAAIFTLPSSLACVTKMKAEERNRNINRFTTKVNSHRVCWLRQSQSKMIEYFRWNDESIHTIALSIDTSAVTRTRWIHAISYRRKSKWRKKKQILYTQQTHK